MKVQNATLMLFEDKSVAVYDMTDWREGERLREERKVIGSTSVVRCRQKESNCLAYLMECAWSFAVKYGVNPVDLHKELLKVDAYREVYQEQCR